MLTHALGRVPLIPLGLTPVKQVSLPDLEAQSDICITHQNLQPNFSSRVARWIMEAPGFDEREESMK